MAIKKKTASKPARSAAKKSVKSKVKKAAKSATKKTVNKTASKSAIKSTRSSGSKPAKAVKKKTTVTKKAIKKTIKKATPKPAPKKALHKVVKFKTKLKNQEVIENKSLVSVTPKQQSVVKNESAKPSKVVIPKTTTKSSIKYEPEFTRSILDAPPEPVQTGPTLRYSDAELAEFKEIILKKLDAAKKELAYLQGLITRKDEEGDMDEARYMTMEDGSVSMEREQLSQMASRQITFIDHLEKALMRIENKTYGICRVTGKLIDKARLRAVPHATLSIEAKQMMNK